MEAGEQSAKAWLLFNNQIIQINKSPFVIGRSLNCDYIVKSKNVSRQHCHFVLCGTDWYLEDTSTNGSMLKGVVIKQGRSRKLVDHDLIQLGTPEFSFTFTLTQLESLHSSTHQQPQSSSYDDLTASSDSHSPVHKRLKTENQPASSNSNQTASNHVNQVASNQIIHVASLQTTGTTDVRIATNSVASDVRVQSADDGESLTRNNPSFEIMPVICLDEISNEVVVPNENTEEINNIGTENHVTSSTVLTGGNNLENPGAPGITHLNVGTGEVNSTDRNPGNTGTRADHTYTKSGEEPTPVMGKGNNEVDAKPTINAASSYSLVEDELLCSICAELFVKAVTLACSHTFCKFCIHEWKKNKSICPICRAAITTISPTIVLDNFIDKIVENSEEELKTHRKELIAGRDKATEKANAKFIRITRQATRNTRTTAHSTSSANHRVTHQNHATSAATSVSESHEGVYVVSSEEEYTSNEETDHEQEYDYDDDEYGGDRPTYTGRAGAYFGGYGRCYNCGSRGHWANGCPLSYY